jgi:enoyl-CoA hydratase/carnithine racemase
MYAVITTSGLQRTGWAMITAPPRGWRAGRTGMEGLMDYDNLLIEQRGDVAVVTFNRPAKANALSHAHLADIEAAALAFRDSEARVVVFTGAGRHFSSGADLDPGDRTTAPLMMRRRTIRIGQRAIRALADMDQITIAAWNGAAVGGGACIATALDFRIGADDCFIAYPEIDLGLNLMWHGLPLITHLVGPARAKRLVIGGERVAAPTLLDWGVLDEMVPPAALMHRTLELAAFYAAKSPVAAQMIKRSVNAITGALDQAVMHMDFDQNLLAASGRDQVEAARAYLAGRPPKFTGE